MQELNFNIKSIDQLSRVADEIVNQMGKIRIIAFYGAMGTGKTTLIKHICQSMGISHIVNSPTFALVNEYFSETKQVYHFDFYRINKPEELMDIGIEEYLYSGHFCFVEWPELAEQLLPPYYSKVLIQLNTDQSRSIQWKPQVQFL